MKDIQATGKASSRQKKPSSTSKHESSEFFFNFSVGHFGPSGSGYSRPKSIRIHVDPDLAPDPDPQHWLEYKLVKCTTLYHFFEA
jgi:hypothetical protein